MGNEQWEINWKDYYDILQVNQNAEEEAIRGVYVSLSKKYHPDNNHEPYAKEKTQKINEAYEVLKDSTKRKEYDIAWIKKYRPTSPPPRPQPSQTQKTSTPVPPSPHPTTPSRPSPPQTQKSPPSPVVKEKFRRHIEVPWRKIGYIFALIFEIIAIIAFLNAGIPELENAIIFLIIFTIIPFIVILFSKGFGKKIFFLILGIIGSLIFLVLFIAGANAEKGEIKVELIPILVLSLSSLVGIVTAFIVRTRK
ncbi:MAG: DnaJ domain-containing protein [Oscillospiraceae bacterium]|nr:DnaJ domain-containing protein [Oscillospiraceae bacterium]